MLIDEVIKKAREKSRGRVWLITINDNTHAIRFYQKRGFSLVGLHINAIQKSREIKPQIPLYGIDNIPILHGIEFEIIL
jgi:ribosomal protein S18 acetylase RimI-like enzyme